MASSGKLTPHEDLKRLIDQAHQGLTRLSQAPNLQRFDSGKIQWLQQQLANLSSQLIEITKRQNNNDSTSAREDIQKLQAILVHVNTLNEDLRNLKTTPKTKVLPNHPPPPKSIEKICIISDSDGTLTNVPEQNLFLISEEEKQVLAKKGWGYLDLRTAANEFYKKLLNDPNVAQYDEDLEFKPQEELLQIFAEEFKDKNGKRDPRRLTEDAIEFLQEMLRLKKAGKVEFYLCTNHSPAYLKALLAFEKDALGERLFSDDDINALNINLNGVDRFARAANVAKNPDYQQLRFYDDGFHDQHSSVQKMKRAAKAHNNKIDIKTKQATTNGAIKWKWEEEIQDIHSKLNIQDASLQNKSKAKRPTSPLNSPIEKVSDPEITKPSISSANNASTQPQLSESSLPPPNKISSEAQKVQKQQHSTSVDIIKKSTSEKKISTTKKSNPPDTKPSSSASIISSLSHSHSPSASLTSSSTSSALPPNLSSSTPIQPTLSNSAVISTSASASSVATLNASTPTTEPEDMAELLQLLIEMENLRDLIAKNYAESYTPYVPWKSSRSHFFNVLDNQILILRSAMLSQHIKNENGLNELETAFKNATTEMKIQLIKQTLPIGKLIDFEKKYSKAVHIIRKYSDKTYIAAPSQATTQKIAHADVLKKAQDSKNRQPGETDEAAFQRHLLASLGTKPSIPISGISAGEKAHDLTTNFLSGELYVSQIPVLNDKPFVLAASRTDNSIRIKTYQIPDSLNVKKAWAKTCPNDKDLYEQVIAKLKSENSKKEISKTLHNTLIEKQYDKESIENIMQNFSTTYQPYNEKNKLPHDSLLIYAISVIDSLQGKIPIIIRNALSAEQVMAIILVARDRGYDKKDILTSLPFRNVKVSNSDVERFHKYAMQNKTTLGYEPLKISEQQANKAREQGYTHYKGHS